MNPVRGVVPLETVELTRYHRQINLKGWDLEGQERLKAATVLVVGLGGLGCTVAQQLALAGVGQLILLDGDRVELSNLARQVLHEQSRIGHYKVNSAAEALARLNPHVQLTAIPEFADEVTLPDLLSGVDLVVDCCDNLASRNLINLCCRAAFVPLVMGSAIRFEGQVAFFGWGDEEPCYGCFSRLFAESDGSCVVNGVAGPLVSLVGSLQALEALKFLTGVTAPQRGSLLLVDGLSLEFERVSLRPDPRCRVCGGKARVCA